MNRIITTDAALAAIEAEYDRQKAWQTGGLQLAWIEKALHDASEASLYGFTIKDIFQVALLLRKAGITPEELREIGGNMDAIFDLLSGLLKQEQQEMINEALSHWLPPLEG